MTDDDKAKHKAELAKNVKADLDKYGEWQLREDDENEEIRRHLILDGGARGIYTGEAIIEIAQQYGFEPDEDDAGNPHITVADDLYNETTDEATEFLNRMLPDGFYVYQDEGFFVEQRRDIQAANSVELDLAAELIAESHPLLAARLRQRGELIAEVEEPEDEPLSVETTA